MCFWGRPSCINQVCNQGRIQWGAQGARAPPNLQWWLFSLVITWYSTSKISKNRRKIAKKWARNAQKLLSAGDPPQTPLGELTMLPRLPKPPPQTPPPSTPSVSVRHLRWFKTNVPPNQFPGSAPVCNVNFFKILSFVVEVKVNRL